MTMKTKILALVPLALLIACSETSHTNSSSITDDNGSYAEDSFNSSSSISERLDIEYRDTITAGDTLNFYTWSRRRLCPETV